MTRNRLLIIIGVLTVIVIGLAIYTFAILLPHTGQNSAASVTPTAAPGTITTKGNRARKISGIIQSLGNQSFVIKASSGKKLTTVNVDSTTKYTSFTGTITFADLKVGDNVTVKGRLDPSTKAILAQSVTITPPTGTVTVVSGSTITLTSAATQTSVTIHTSSATIVSIGTIPVSSSFIVAGQTIAYAGTTASDGSINATNIYLTLKSEKGSVTTITSQSITVQSSSGTSQVIPLSSHTTYVHSGTSGATPTVVTSQSIQTGNTVTVYVETSATGTNTAVLVEVS
ncbi:MAG TPA: DUF5666 domain-containing protein [Ktedonobacteraceae bacterium]|nr:DUF5666 domain-containing protein [Ktedonobacteraceae bacterium]